MMTNKNKKKMAWLIAYSLFLIMAMYVFGLILEPYVGKMDGIIQVHVDGMTMMNGSGLDGWLVGFDDSSLFMIDHINELGTLHPLVQLQVTLFYMTFRDVLGIAFIWSMGYIFITHMSLNFNKKSGMFKLIIWMIRITFMIMLTNYYGIGFTVLVSVIYYLVLLPTVVKNIVRPAMEGLMDI